LQKNNDNTTIVRKAKICYDLFQKMNLEFLILIFVYFLEKKILIFHRTPYEIRYFSRETINKSFYHVKFKKQSIGEGRGGEKFRFALNNIYKIMFLEKVNFLFP